MAVTATALGSDTFAAPGDQPAPRPARTEAPVLNTALGPLVDQPSLVGTTSLPARGLFAGD